MKWEPQSLKLTEKIMSNLTFPTEKELGFRPFILPSSKIVPVKQIYSGYEIEKKFILLTKEEDYTNNKNGLALYDQVLQEGVLIEQGYIKDIQEAKKLLDELGIELSDFKPNTIRLRRFGPGYQKKNISPNRYVLTLKDRKETKIREVEFKLTVVQFLKYWDGTEGARVFKKRLKKTIRSHEFELDAFIDRLLLIAECEVSNEKLLAKVPALGNDVTADRNWSNKSLSK